MESTQIVWNKDSLHELKIYKRITWPMGIWPLDCQNKFSTFRTGFALIIQTSFMISLIGETCQNCIPLDLKIDLIANLSCAIMSFVKIALLRIHHKKLFIIITSSITDWSLNRDENSLKIMKSFAHTSRFFYYGQTFFAVFTVVIMIFTNVPLLLADESKRENLSLPLNPLPLPTNCFYRNMSKTINTGVYVLQSFQLSCTALGNCGTDIFFFGIAMHVCAQLKILHNNMSSLGKKYDDDDKITLRSDLGLLIKRHNRLLDTSQYLESSFNGILMFQLIFNSLLIIILGIQIIVLIKAGDAIILPRMILSLIVLMAQLFIYCYAGEYLTTLNKLLLNAIYSSSWYNFPSNTSKDLIFMMMRAQVRFHLTAGKFYNMDMENFKNIVKASLSYMSVLMVMLKLDEK